MKISLLGIVGLSLLAMTLIAIPFGALFYFINSADRQEKQRDREWMDYSQQHHCKVIHEGSFSQPQTTWQCDGDFQVRRMP